MRKKQRFLGRMFVLLLLGCLAAGVVLVLGPDKARRTWQSLTAKLSALAARPVSPAPTPPQPPREAVVAPTPKPALAPPVAGKSVAQSPPATAGGGSAPSQGGPAK